MECLSSRREREAPGGRARENRKVIQARSPESWSETISGGEEVLAGKSGGLFLGYLLGKNFRRRDRDHLVPPRRMDAAVCRPEVCCAFGRTHGRHRAVKRRDFIALIGGAAAWPLAARAQQPAKVARVGFLRFGSASAFAMSSTEVEADRQVTNTIPIVFATHADPVGLGHVASLARPGGNITGLTTILTDLVAKELEVLKEAVPQATRIGVLFSPTAPSHRPAVQAVETAGEKLGVQLVMVPARAVEDFEGAFSTLSREHVGGFVVVDAPLTVSHRARLAELALKHRLPGIFGTKENVEAGGLMSYGPDFNDMCRRAAIYIDKILKGVKPAELPVEQASKYELIINLKTAKAIGLAIPESFLLRADGVIE